MANYTVIARPYAKAIFEIASQQKAVGDWSKLLQLMAFIVKKPEVQVLLDNPRITRQQTYDFFLKLCVQVCKANLTKEAENLIQLLSQYDRLIVLPYIATLFEEYRIEQEKRVKVQVTAATELTTEQQEKLIKVLTKRLQREVILNCQIDNALLGGMVIQADDFVIDGSVRGKLTRLEQELLG